MEQNTVFRKELYSISELNAKRIFHQEFVKIQQNAVFNPKWSKRQFLRKSCIPSVDLIQKPFFRREIVKIWQNAVFNSKKDENTVLRKELYSISGFDAKRIFTENS